MSDTVTISKTLYDLLIHSQKMLSALEAAGVDNWEWYGDAISEMYEEEETEEDIYGPDVS